MLNYKINTLTIYFKIYSFALKKSTEEFCVKRIALKE